jgi:hypothetical protein
MPPSKLLSPKPREAARTPREMDGDLQRNEESREADAVMETALPRDRRLVRDGGQEELEI